MGVLVPPNEGEKNGLEEGLFVPLSVVVRERCRVGVDGVVAEWYGKKFMLSARRCRSPSQYYRFRPSRER